MYSNPAYIFIYIWYILYIVNDITIKRPRGVAAPAPPPHRRRPSRPPWRRRVAPGRWGSVVGAGEFNK